MNNVTDKKAAPTSWMKICLHRRLGTMEGVKYLDRKTQGRDS